MLVTPMLRGIPFVCGCYHYYHRLETPICKRTIHATRTVLLPVRQLQYYSEQYSSPIRGAVRCVANGISPKTLITHQLIKHLNDQ